MANQEELTQPGRVLFTTASSERVQLDARALEPYLAYGRWLGSANRYTRQVADTLKKDLGNGPLSSVQQKHLRELIAASCPTHVMDGWAILGRAVSASLSGDQNSARHFAYYAELRAAAALLSRSGIGLFNRTHAVVQQDGRVEIFGGTHFKGGQRGTHVAAWAFLEQWSKSQDAADLLAAILEPEGIRLEMWFPGTPAWARWAASASSWLRELGLEVRLMARDQYARNEASYRPTTLRHDLNAPEAETVANFTNSLWKLLEPSGRPFANLDRFILRTALERAYRAAHGPTANLISAGYQNDLGALVAAQGFSEVKADRVLRFLKRMDSPQDPPLLAEALTRSTASAPYHHLQAIGRAALLLRVATGAAKQLLDEAGIDSDTTGFWWQSLARARGICDPLDPDDLTDVWADVQDAISTVQEWVPTDVSSFVELGEDPRGPILRVLGQFELAGLVGLTA